MSNRREVVKAADGALSEVERGAAVALLNQACGAGLLPVQEFSARVEDAQVARTAAELDRLVADLPAAAPDPAEPRTDWHVAPVGGIRRAGRWLVDRRLVSLSVLGGACLDLRDAELTAPEVTLTTVSALGGVTLCVPAGVRVVVETCGLLGRRNVEISQAAGPGAPTLRVRAFSLFGGITVERPRTGLLVA